jgi:hypothetical protein
MSANEKTFVIIQDEIGDPRTMVDDLNGGISFNQSPYVGT